MEFSEGSWRSRTSCLCRRCRCRRFPRPAAGAPSTESRPAWPATSRRRRASWRSGRTASTTRRGVGCWECHNADPKNPAAFRHEGATIVTVVSPDACAPCHGDIVAEFQASHHASAAKFIGSLDNVLGEIVEGRLAAVNGCWQCHGSTLAFLKNADGSVQKSATGAPRPRPGDLAEHRHRPREPRRDARLLHGVPQPPRLLQGDGAPAGGLRQVPPRARPPAGRDLRGEQARHRLPDAERAR